MTQLPQADCLSRSKSIGSQPEEVKRPGGESKPLLSPKSSMSQRSPSPPTPSLGVGLSPASQTCHTVTPALDGISAATYLIEAIVRSRNLDLSSHTQKWYHCVNTFLRFLCSPRLPLCVPTSTSNRRAQNFGPASSVRHWMDMLRVWSRGFNRGAWCCH